MDNYELRRVAYDAVASGDAEIVDENEWGEPVFALTEKARQRAIEIIDEHIARYGHEAPETLAEASDLPLEVGEQLVAMRLSELRP